MEDYENYPEDFDFPDNLKLKIKAIFDEDDSNSAEEEISAEIENCIHSETILEGNQEYCANCNRRIIPELSGFSTNSKFFGNKDKEYSKDVNRTHARKTEIRRIDKDVNGMDFPKSIIESANRKYQKIIEDKIYRGANRKAIIGVCIFYAYMEQQEPILESEISKKFNIKKKAMKKGFQKYSECFKEDSNIYITVKNLIKRILIKTNIDLCHLKKINKLCDFLENKSQLLNRSNPSSVAASIVYLYLCFDMEYKNKLGLTKSNFSKTVELSDITITKLGKEIQTIIQCQDIKI